MQALVDKFKVDPVSSGHIHLCDYCIKPLKDKSPAVKQLSLWLYASSTASLTVWPRETHKMLPV